MPAALTISPPTRRHAAGLAVGAIAGCGIVALVDPNVGGRYPSCPTAALLGIDCPACGTLRGLHALTHGRLVDALDHNLLLAVAVPLATVLWLGWVWRAAGHEPPRLRIPSWALSAAVAIAIAFMVARNVPIDGLHWLDAA